MDMDQYQIEASKTAVFPQEKAIEYTAVALAGETGELCNYVGKFIRGDFEKMDRQKLIVESGGILWELAMFLKVNGISMNEVAEANIEKLRSRMQRGVLKGSGDDR